jgi:hypothetical protein
MSASHQSVKHHSDPGGIVEDIAFVTIVFSAVVLAVALVAALLIAL